VYCRGEPHGANVAPSREHSKVEFASLAEKPKLALVLEVSAGGAAPIVVSGAAVSIVQLWIAGVPSGLPAASLARTWNWWAPAARLVYCRGDEQAVKVAPSSEHSNVEPASLAEKEKLALVLDVSAGGAAPIVVSGAAVSIIHRWTAGVGSTFPDASVAWTRNSWIPSARPTYCRGEAHAAKAAPSSEHANDEPGLLEENEKLALALGLSAGGPESIVVSGSVVSGGGWIVQL
jgi:hypothetical protein